MLQQLCNRGGPQGKPVLRELSKFAPEDTRPKAPPLRQDMPMSIKPPAPALPVMPPEAGPAKWKLADVYAGEVTMEEFVAQMDVVEMVCLVTGIGMGPGGKLLQPVLDPVTTPIPGATGVTASILRLGIPSIVLSDGPAGVKVPYKKNQIAFPTGQSLASTWNTVLAEELGACAGGEAADNLVDVWLAPAMNLHRNPLCGRNYEYYAEDPLLSGKLAAAVTRGAACSNVGTCLKHFAANNQETNRFYGVDAVVSERTLRELYLRSFEIAVQEGAPRAIMTAYNSINGEYCSTKRELLEDIVRGEWGFEGIFMTDWEGGGPYAVESLEAGNDLLMPGAPGQRRYLLDCVLSGRLSRETLEACCGRILRLVLASNSFQVWLKEGR